jgi:hypothetical protein
MNTKERSTRVLLAVIALLLGANLLVQIGTASGPKTAQAAGIPDSGAQFQSMIEQLTELNKKVDKMQAYFESGALTVKVKEPKADK